MRNPGAASCLLLAAIVAVASCGGGGTNTPGSPGAGGGNAGGGSGQGTGQGGNPNSGDCRQTPCIGMFYCDLSNGQCKPGCASDAQCGTNESCDVATRTCGCKTGFGRCGAMCIAAGAEVRDCGGVCATCPTANATASACQGTSCVATACAPGYHICAGSCVSNSSVATCGTACSACAIPPNSTATCDGTTCGRTCNAGSMECGGACAACPATGAPFVCQGTSCAATTCAASGFELCGGACAACPTANATAFACSGTSCVATACAPGHHICSGACVSNMSINSCGTSCTPCQRPPGATIMVTTCDGTQCNGRWAPCSGACLEPYICDQDNPTDTAYNGVCAPLCTNVATCPAPATGNATIVCRNTRVGRQLCVLSCANGETCPDGMICYQDSHCYWMTPRRT